MCVSENYLLFKSMRCGVWLKFDFIEFVFHQQRIKLLKLLTSKLLWSLGKHSLNTYYKSRWKSRFAIILKEFVIRGPQEKLVGWQRYFHGNKNYCQNLLNFQYMQFSNRCCNIWISLVVMFLSCWSKIILQVRCHNHYTTGSQLSFCVFYPIREHESQFVSK